MARCFFFTRMVLFPPLDKRNIRYKTKGLLDRFGEAYRGGGGETGRAMS